ncbi:hypothetical protein TTHERM_00259339 (macronuclear) [Tetrahymena thermophila SB210]|uniref:Uncharacterized protein n=1 Tax=Tetrahymena thermophila (strain SB210) TaxID=312017 RepID=A4VEN7_TETTS|nr:hypothetical protein TTHERM_00259339 [Tetrahymena thermophila SB210]EDK31985.2 hypothetical protein TTHERM_00259339 [Tetrahymena thermophila SB210]|eukprot:XP_001471145.2 hypothetical protein TTHERM_00259339 [Tetrahymena thermophila SB210]
MSLQIISIFLSIVEQYKELNESTYKHDYPDEEMSEVNVPNFNNSNIKQDTILTQMDQVIQQKYKHQHQLFLNTSQKFQQKQNIIKNIIKSFSKYLKSLSNEKATQRFSSILGTNKSFCNIKKNFLKQMKKKNNRWNHILKRLICSKDLSKIFKSYLERESICWLAYSKTDNVYDHKQMINLLKEALQSEEQLQIITYKKK